MVLEIAIIPHSPHVVGKRAPVARVERVVRHDAFDAVTRRELFDFESRFDQQRRNKPRRRYA